MDQLAKALPDVLRPHVLCMIALLVTVAPSQVPAELQVLALELELEPLELVVH